MRSIEDSMIISKYDNLQECRGWAARIPALMDVPASIDVRLPFRESIATTTFILYPPII